MTLGRQNDTIEMRKQERVNPNHAERAAAEGKTIMCLLVAYLLIIDNALEAIIRETVEEIKTALHHRILRRRRAESRSLTG
jgi:hypothetical protein